MSALTLRTARFSQPRGVCGVNRALVPPGSIVYNPAAGKVNLANGEFATQIGKLALEYNYLGVADNGYLESDKAPRFNCPTTTAFTLLAVGEFSDPAPIIGGDDAGNRCYQFRRNSGQVQFIRFNSDFSSAFTAQVSYTSGQTVFVAVSDGTAVKVYSSSGSVGTATISGTPSPVTLFAPNGLFTYDNGPNVTDRINLAALIAKPLSDIEVYQLLKNPWQIFAPEKKSVYFDGFVSGGGLSLTQSSRFDNTNSFFAHTVTPGAVSLTQSARFDNASSFYAHTLTQSGGGQSLSQSARFDNVNSFFAHTVMPGSITVTQSNRFDNVNTFYAHTISQGGATQTLTQSNRFNNVNNFYSHTVTTGPVSLAQSARFDNVNSFYSHAILQAGLQYLTQTDRFDNINQFFTLIVNDETIWRNLMNYSTIVDLALGYVDRRNDPEAVAVMDSMLRLVESKINRFLQSSKGGSVIYVEILDAEQDYYDLPNLFSSYRSIFISTTQDSSAVKTVLEYATPYKLANASSGHYYTIINDKLKIYSDAIAVGSYIEMVSYLSITPLTSADPNNWLSDLYPDCYVHGLMAQLYAFAKDWPAAERMETKFTQTLDEIEIQDDKTTWSGTPLVMRSA